MPKQFIILRRRMRKNNKNNSLIIVEPVVEPVIESKCKPGRGRPRLASKALQFETIAKRNQRKKNNFYSIF